MRCKLFLVLLCFLGYSFAENPVCDNTERGKIYESHCYSLGDEFIFFGKTWPEYKSGEKFPEEGSTCFDEFTISEVQNVEKISKNGIHYISYALGQYCCKHQVFHTTQRGYTEFSYYGKFGTLYSECEYYASDRVKVQFAETKLQKPIDKADVLNFFTNVKNMFGSTESAMVKLTLLASIEKQEEMLFKIYRWNGTIKYIGGVNLGLCMSKNGKKALDFSEGSANCK